MEIKLDSKEFENLCFKPLDYSTTYEEILDCTKKHGSSDIDALNFELESINNEFNNTLKRLDEIDFEFIDTIDKKSYELLLKNFQELGLLHEKLKNDIKIIQTEIEESKSEYEEILRKCDELRLTLETSKRSLTPRPEWRKCAKILDGKEKEWQTFFLNKTSEELVVLLINEFLGTCIKSNDDEFYLSGLPPIRPVPNYFIASLNNLNKDSETNPGFMVKNRRLNRRELAFCIKELWNAKFKCFEKNETSEKLYHFVFEYFLDKFKSKELAIEWTVNLKDSCVRYSKNERARFLLDVLNQKKDEDIIFHLYSKLKNFLLEVPSKSNYEGLKTTMLKNFPQKSFDQINFLIESIKYQLMNGKITFEDLFDEFDENLGIFLSCFNIQINEKKNIYIAKILDNIKMNSNEINIFDFIECIQKVDPNITENDLKKYCDWIFDKKSELYLIGKDEFIEKLNNGNFFFHSKV